MRGRCSRQPNRREGGEGMAIRRTEALWTGGLARLLFAALVMALLGFPVAAQAQETPSDPQEQELAEGAQAEQPAEEGEEEELPAESFAGEVVVVGVRESMIEAVEIKRESIPIVDAIVAEDIGKFPDNNVVEAMQRIPGVQVTNRGGGEVSSVSIRGLADVTTTVNGRNIFTSSGRSVALADIPATLVRGVEVYKTRSPEHIARGIAGGIDIRTFRPFDFDGFQVSAQGRGIYQEQTEEIDPNIAFLLSNRWETGAGEFGALLNVSWAQTNWLNQGVHAGAAVPFRLPDDPVAPLERLFPPLWTPGTENGLPTAAGSTLDDGTPYVLGRDAMFQPHTQGERERPAANLSLQWAPNDRSEYLFEAFYDGYRNTQHNSLFFTFVDWWGGVDPNDPVEIFPGTNVVRSRYVNAPYEFISGDVLEQETDSFMYAVGGKWDVGDNLIIESELVYQTSEFQDEFFALRMDKVSPRLFVDFNTGDGVPYVEFFDDPNTPQDESDLTDASQWNLAQLYDNGQKDKGDAFTWTGDGDLNLDWASFYRLSFGLRYDDRTAEENSYLGPDRHCNDAPGCAGLTAADFPGLMGTTRNHFDGQAQVLTSWAIPTQDGLLSNQEAIRAAWGYLPGGEKVFTNEFNIDETQIEGYVQADFSTQGQKEAGYIDGRIGLRALDQQTDMSFPDPETGGTAEDSNSNSVILPSVMLRWAIVKDLMARLSYAETFNLPTFAQLNPYIVYVADVTNIGYGTASGGNPDLEPIESQNLDLSLEWYFAEGSVVYATWFKRDITNNIVDYRNVVQYDDPDDDPDRGLYDYVLSQPDNTGDATLDGWEFGLTWFPELPGLLDGLGIQGSFTLLDSERKEPIQDDAGNVIGEDILDIMGVSDTSYSLILAYDRTAFSARLSWFWRDDFHDRDEAALFANPIQIWKSEEESLDFQATWYINDHWALTFDGNNLTAPVFHENYGNQPELFNFYNWYYSRTYALGVRYQFSKI
ncbi:MAG TPA: TonB-dependent receptor [Thermoanaerobaculales bacterium]|nr:TonB-dependent receptor [Thermoanaerobaculales bacterium]